MSGFGGMVSFVVDADAAGTARVVDRRDNAVVLDRGALVAEGDGAAIRADPKVREIYLGTGTASGGH